MGTKLENANSVKKSTKKNGKGETTNETHATPKTRNEAKTCQCHVSGEFSKIILCPFHKLTEQFLDALEDDLIEQRAELCKAKPATGGFEHGVVSGMDQILGKVIDRIQAHYANAERGK